MSARRGKRRLMGEINVVPYIDVMLVLLIIFMITAPLLTQGVKVDLPQAQAKAMEDKKHQEPLVLTVDANGQYFLNIGEDTKTPIDAKTVVARTAAVLKHKPGTQVLVRADKNVKYDAVIGGMVLLQQAGAPSVGLITEPPGAQ